MRENTTVEDIESAEDVHSEAIANFLEQYKKYGENLQSANSKTQEELDKSLITLSTVIIGVILTLRQQIAAGAPTLGFPIFMWIPITLLILCVLGVLISHFLSLWVNGRLIDAIDNLQQADDPLPLVPEVEKAHKKRLWVRVSNYASAGLFFFGLVATVAFAVYGAGLRGQV